MRKFYAFSKRIKEEKQIQYQEISDNNDTAKINSVIQNLENLPKAATLLMNELDLRTNPKEWIISLIRSYPDNVEKHEMEYLLFDFTDSMQTRMREESKYAIGLLTEHKLFLCHSLFGEETITPEWKTIPRMLDADNVLRFACFTDIEGIAKAIFWEREATSSFIEWLGLPHKHAFLFGGKYRICAEIEGFTAELQLTEDDMDRVIKQHKEISKGRIQLANPIRRLNITEVRAGRKRYDNTKDFLQDYEAEKHGVSRYQKFYEKMKSDMIPLIVKHYDEKSQVVRIENGAEVAVLKKDTPEFDILFANNDIDIRASYLADLVGRFVNGDNIKIIHAGLQFRATPYELAGIAFYNEIKTDELVHNLCRYYDDTDLQDRTLFVAIKCAIMEILAQLNHTLPLFRFFKLISNELANELCLGGRLSKLEDSAIEYKSREFFTGKDQEIVDRFAQDMRNKLRQHPCKIYLIGVEDNGALNPIESSRLGSDRVANIKQKIEAELKDVSLHALPMIQDSKGLLFILSLNQSSNGFGNSFE